jgi:hypothetical protein
MRYEKQADRAPSVNGHRKKRKKKQVERKSKKKNQKKTMAPLASVQAVSCRPNQGTFGLALTPVRTGRA